MNKILNSLNLQESGKIFKLHSVYNKHLISTAKLEVKGFSLEFKYCTKCYQITNVYKTEQDIDMPTVFDESLTDNNLKYYILFVLNKFNKNINENYYKSIPINFEYLVNYLYNTLLCPKIKNCDEKIIEKLVLKYYT